MTWPRIAVIGGGIAGLTAAWELARAGRAEFTLYEASGRLGGIVKTVHTGGFTIEGGPDSWVTEKPWARELAEELGLGDDLIFSQVATRRTYILRHGQLVAMPDRMHMMVPSDLAALDASPLFSPAARRMFHVELSRAEALKAAAPIEDESVAAFVRRHFGEEVLATVAAPLLSGVFGGDVGTLSVQAVMPAFVRMEREHGSLVRAVQLAARTQPKAVFTTLRQGLGSLVDALTHGISASSVRLNTTVTALRRSPEGWIVRSSAGERGYDSVLVAMPADVASRLLQEVDPRAAQLMQMDASSAAIVAFGFSASFELPRGFGFLVPPGSAGPDSLLAATFMDQKFPGRVPLGGRLIRAFFGGENGARLLEASDGTLSQLALDQLRSILGPLPEPMLTVVRRWPRSLPQYAVGHLQRMAELEARVRALGGLWLLGNGYRGVGLPDVIRDAGELPGNASSRQRGSGRQAPKGRRNNAKA